MSAKPSSVTWPVRLLLLMVFAALTGAAPARAADDFEAVVHDLRLELSPEAVGSLKQNPRAYVHARLEADGQRMADVAVHLKGATGSFQPLDDKPGLTVDFDRYVRGHEFFGMTKIHLNNSVEDPSYLCEVIAGDLFQIAGIPVARTGHAVVRLNGRRLGLYVLKEGFERSFLQRELRGMDGAVLEPERGQDVDGLLHAHGDQAAPAPGKMLAELASAAREPDPAKRWARLSAVLDTDRFIRFMAVEVMIGHRDGYSLAKNNFRVLLPTETRRAVFLPQGLDQLFQVAELPWQPSVAGLVAQAALETPEGHQRYAQEFATLRPVLLQPTALAARIDAVSTRLVAAVSWSEAAGLREEATLLKERIRQRAAALERQLNTARSGSECIAALPLSPRSASVRPTVRDLPLEFAEHATH
ncbi:MAG TPA: CotH kinase family protein [Candidatus Limnocylindria bacterium]|jgi:hypothetical protein|nr:CotH kinase family protein [Candidatus Limnocylindria bacterium]